LRTKIKRKYASDNEADSNHELQKLKMSY